MFAKKPAKLLFDLLCIGIPNWALLDELREKILEIENNSNDTSGYYKPDPRNVMLLVTIYIMFDEIDFARIFLELIQFLPETDMIICDGNLNLKKSTKPLLIHIENNEIAKLHDGNIKIIAKIFENLGWLY